MKRILFILIIILATFSIYLLNHPQEKILENVTTTTKRTSSAISMMIEQEDGTYQKSSSNTWPQEDSYTINTMKSGCERGSRLSWNEETKEVKIFSTKSDRCYLYFDKSLINVLRKKDNQEYLSKDLQGGMYRYQASFPECNNESACENATKMTNWICFGTTENCGSNEELIDKYMYRIIGITKDNQLYLIKETILKEGLVNSFAWNDTYMTSSVDSFDVCPNGNCPEWNESLLFKRINGISNGTSLSSDANVKANSDIFVDSKEYDYLQSGDTINGGNKASDWYNMIANHEWMYGDTALEYSNPNLYNGKNMYEIETGVNFTIRYKNDKTIENYKWSVTNKVTSKISLMYIHDYLYAYPNSNPEYNNNAKNSWIFFLKDGFNSMIDSEWLSIRWGLSANTDYVYDARFIYQDGSISNYGLPLTFGVRPVFYLTANVELTGNGTKDSPFIINLVDGV